MHGCSSPSFAAGNGSPASVSGCTLYSLKRTSSWVALRGVPAPPGPFLYIPKYHLSTVKLTVQPLCSIFVEKAECVYSSRMEVDGVKLREIRLDAGFSQDELHQMTGVSRDTISKMETGDRPNPHPRTLRKLAQALGVSVADIRRRDGNGR